VTTPLIAIVDDDQRVLESLEDLLESAGYRVRGFASGMSLLADPELPQVGCVITDIGMADCDGFRLRRALQHGRPQLPVILISGRKGLSNQATTEPDSFFLAKPFDGCELLRLIVKALPVP
jgi:FixJ family two-component response regulator